MRTFIVAAVMLAGAAGNNRFAVELYARLRIGDANMIVSPFNVAEALAMVEQGTSGETSRQLRSVMHAELPRAKSAIWMKAAWKTSGARRVELPHAARGLTNTPPPHPAFGHRRPRAAGERAPATSLLPTEGGEGARSADGGAPRILTVLRDVRFNPASTFSLAKPLQRLGVRRLFNRADGAELSGMTTSASPLFVSDVVHAARIIVDEEGTEASAASDASTIVTATTPPPPPTPFIADHPFLYIIRSGDQILFIGRVVDPRS